MKPVSWVCLGLTLLTILVVPGNAQAQTGCDDLSGLPQTLTRLNYRVDILPLLRDAGCAGCHTTGGIYPNLTAAPVTPLIDLIFSIGGNGTLAFVEPFDPERSYLFQKVNCQQPNAGERMPLAGAALTLQQQGLLYDWIWQGAYGEVEAGVVGRLILFRSGAESLRH